MTIWLRGDDNVMKCAQECDFLEGAFASRLAPTSDPVMTQNLCSQEIPCGSEPAREQGRNDLAQSSSAFTAFGDKRKLRRLRLTLLR
ncbi:hypothetical protein DMX03_01925 [Pseudomonas koreensis]|nr:hypothetical protein DMX03_01925 [Pseudomonas koreensis]